MSRQTASPDRQGPLTAIDLRDQRFPVRPLGFAREAVRGLLADVADELERLTRAGQQSEDRVRQVEAELLALAARDHEIGRQQQLIRQQEGELRRQLQLQQTQEQELLRQQDVLRQLEQELFRQQQQITQRETHLTGREQALDERERALLTATSDPAPAPTPSPEPERAPGRTELRSQAEREAQLIIREARAAAERQMNAAQAELRKLQAEVPALWAMRQSELARLRQELEHQLLAVTMAEEASPPDLLRERAARDAGGQP